MNQELIALSKRVEAIDEGTRTTFVCVDEDLVALDQRIDRRRQECERTDYQLQEVKDRLRAAEDQILALEESKKDYREMLLEMRVRIEAMEGQLCHCGMEKGKEVETGGPSVLGSPLVLDRPEDEGHLSDDSFNTPPSVGPSSSSQPSSTVVESDKENVPSFGIGFDPKKLVLIPVEDTPPENIVPLPIREPVLNISGLEQLVAVRGQRAVRSAGRPKSAFHPYPRPCLCPIGVRSSSHRRSERCCSD